MRPVGELVRDYARRARAGNRSYAQAGEDRIASHVLHSIRIDDPSYLDLGAHHPTRLSNTYLFYLRGCSGVCVEADPELLRHIRRRRIRDTCLNAAIAPEDGSVAFHVMDATSLSTISDSSVEGYRHMGRRVTRTVEVPALSPATLLERYLDSTPNLVSLDVEGTDQQVLSAWDFERFRPEVFIVETLEYASEGREAKRPEIAELMEAAGYFAYGDTFINTVFVDREAYRRGRRGGPAAG
jgi:FkbM family methyltransferase